MEFSISGDKIVFEIAVDGKSWLVQQDGGEWRLKPGDGSSGVFLAQSRVAFSQVVARAIAASHRTLLRRCEGRHLMPKQREADHHQRSQRRA